MLKIPDKVYNPRHLPTFAIFFREIYQFVPFPQFNVVYRDEVVIFRFQHYLGEEDSHDSLFEITCQRFLLLSVCYWCAMDFCRGLQYTYVIK